MKKSVSAVPTAEFSALAVAQSILSSKSKWLKNLERGLLSGDLTESDFRKKVHAAVQQSDLSRALTKDHLLRALCGDLSSLASAHCLGLRLAIHWPLDKQYYYGTVSGVDVSRSKPLLVRYDDGQCEWLDLKKEVFRVLKLKKSKATTVKRSSAEKKQSDKRMKMTVSKKCAKTRKRKKSEMSDDKSAAKKSKGAKSTERRKRRKISENKEDVTLKAPKKKVLKTEVASVTTVPMPITEIRPKPLATESELQSAESSTAVACRQPLAVPLKDTKVAVLQNEHWKDGVVTNSKSVLSPNGSAALWLEVTLDWPPFDGLKTVWALPRQRTLQVLKPMASSPLAAVGESVEILDGGEWYNGKVASIVLSKEKQGHYCFKVCFPDFAEPESETEPPWMWVSQDKVRRPQ